MITLKLSYTEIQVLYQVHANRIILDKGPYYDLLREHAADFSIFFSVRRNPFYEPGEPVTLLINRAYQFFLNQ